MLMEFNFDFTKDYWHHFDYNERLCHFCWHSPQLIIDILKSVLRVPFSLSMVTVKVMRMLMMAWQRCRFHVTVYDVVYIIEEKQEMTRYFDLGMGLGFFQMQLWRQTNQKMVNMRTQRVFPVQCKYCIEHTHTRITHTQIQLVPMQSIMC